MGGKPTGYNYIKAKDRIKWSDLKPKDFIPLLDDMFYSYVSSLPDVSKK
jgi:hypothetical protein